MSERTFTVAEANELVPMLTELLEGLREAQRVMEERHESVLESVPGNGGGDAGTAYLEATETAARAAAQIEELGIVVRDPSSGLVDFPAVRDGEEIYLCWRLGEESVAWWHPIDTGFAGRQPL